MTAAVRWTTSRLFCRSLTSRCQTGCSRRKRLPVWSPTAACPVVVGGPHTGLLRRIEQREGTCRTVRRSNTLRHSFIADVFCIRVRRLVKAARTCAAKRSRALTSLGTRCDVAARKEYLRVRFLWVSATRRALRKNGGSPQRLQRSSRQDLARGWRLIADGKPASRTEDAGVEHCGRERPGTPEGVLAPKNGDKRGSLPATVWIFPRRNCS